VDPVFGETLRQGIAALGLPVDEEALPRLERFADRLLAWNRKVNLTSITDPAELAEKHLVDSLAILPEVGDAPCLLDVGSGAGLPGVPLAIALPDLEVTCCDAVSKKVAFVKSIAAELDLRVKAVAVRAEGHPEREGLPRGAVVVSRALADPARWLPLAAPYLLPGGRVLAMLGRDVDEEALGRAAADAGLEILSLRRFQLPRSGAERAVAALRVVPGAGAGISRAAPSVA
jgi:16S rRNA (guanine527-N7)-methyltransferase